MTLRSSCWLVAIPLLVACPGDDGPTPATTAGSSGTTEPGTTGDPPPASTGEPSTSTDGTTAGTGPTDTTEGTASSGTSSEPTSSSGGESSSSDSAGTDAGSSSDSGGSAESSSSGGGGTLPIGDECLDDSECITGVCWDFADYDPFCFGTACSFTCMSDMECVAGMTMAGAPNPMASSCGPDGRCSTLGTGFGLYACAAPR